MKGFVILILLFAGISCPAQEKVLKEGRYPDGKLRYKGYFVNNQPAGEVTHYYPEGSVKAVMNHKGGETDAVLYSEKGDVTVSGRYIGQKKTGMWEYRKGEKIVGRETYLDNLLDGTATKYFDSGEIFEVKNWKAGVPDGEWKLFYNNGKIRVEAVFVNGKLDGRIKSYNYDGALAAEGDYKNNLREGDWRYYDKDGKLNKEQKYNKGVVEGGETADIEESRRIDELVSRGKRIADPADFVDDPSDYLKMTE